MHLPDKWDINPEQPYVIGSYITHKEVHLHYIFNTMEQTPKKDQPDNRGKKQILREDDGKRLPPQPKAYGVGSAHSNTHPEQEPNIHPHDRTEGIP